MNETIDSTISSEKPLMTPEQLIRAAQTPEEVAFVLIGLVGKGLCFEQLVGAVVDAKIEDSHLPDGTNRDQVKLGFKQLFGGFAKLFI